MNILFDNLELLIDAPNGIEKARELILQLAIQGKLTEQDPNDEPASELLKKINKEKEKLIAEGKTKKQKELPPIKDEEKPFVLPKGWSFERLGNIAELINGVTYSKSDSSDIPTDGYLPILRANNIKGKINFDGLVYVPIKNVSKNQLLKKFDNVIAMSSGSKSLVGKSAQLSDDFVGSFGAFCGVLRCYAEFNPGFINYFLQSPYYRDGISESSQGIGINNLRKENLLHLIIPTPPYEEQKRIVEKVNSLMALLDELEEKRERRNQKRIKLNNASIEKLLTSKDDKEQKENWKRIEENFNTLYSVPENVERLKQAILQLAVQGKLTSEWRNSIYERHPELVSGSKTSVQLDDGSIYEPASELLKKIKKEKEKLIAEGKIKKQSELPPIKDEEKPFELPNGWEWERFQNITSVITCGMASTPTYTETGRIFLSAKNVKPYRFLPDDYKFVSEETYQKIIQNAKPELNDILLTRVGAGIGEACLIDREIDFAYYVSLTLIKPIQRFILSEYLLNYLSSPLGITNAISKTYGIGVSQGNLNVNQVRKYIIPIPPLSEQKRIIEKVNELMSLCNALEEKLTKKEATAEKLVGAVVNAVANHNKPKDEKAEKKEKLTERINEIIKKHHEGFEKLR